MREKTHDGRHGEDCFGCRIQQVGIAPSAMPSRKNTLPPAEANPAWERGVAGEHRRDGTFMPYLDNKLNPIGLKTFAEKRTELEPLIAENHQHRATVS